jgi:hypothetical protein
MMNLTSSITRGNTPLTKIEARDESGLVVLTREAKTLRAPQSSVWRWTRHAAVR